MTDITGVILDQRGIIAVTGPEARTLLQGLITNDVDAVAPDRAIYAALLTPQGKFLHDFLIAQAGETLLIDCEGSRRVDLLRRLMMYRLRAKVDLIDATDDWTVVALTGEGAAAKLGLAQEAGVSVAYRRRRCVRRSASRASWRPDDHAEGPRRRCARYAGR